MGLTAWPAVNSNSLFFFKRLTGTGGLFRRYLLLQFPRPATLQAAELPAAWPAANFQRSFFLNG
jgi:hypothetical protein